MRYVQALHYSILPVCELCSSARVDVPVRSLLIRSGHAPHTACMVSIATGGGVIWQSHPQTNRRGFASRDGPRCQSYDREPLLIVNVSPSSPHGACVPTLPHSQSFGLGTSSCHGLIHATPTTNFCDPCGPPVQVWQKANGLPIAYPRVRCCP
jgi:hypothetical protein